MDNIDPDILECAKRWFGGDCELVRTTEWSYTFKCGGKSYGTISRWTDESFKVSVPEVRRRWSSMSESERIDFAMNFQAKETWTQNDTEIPGNHHE